MTIEDDVLMAYADGELADDERARVEHALSADPALQARLDQHRRLSRRLSAHYAPIIDETVPDHLAALLRPVPSSANVVDFAAARRKRFLPGWGNMGAIAASLAVGVLVGQMVLPGRGIVESGRQGTLIAHGELARALDVQLASAQENDAPVRIGVSFRNDAGRYCRSFDSRSLSGIACREGGTWHLPLTTSPAAGQSSIGYRQAGSGNALVMEAATAMMQGEPLDGAAERKVRDKGWH